MSKRNCQQFWNYPNRFSDGPLLLLGISSAQTLLLSPASSI
jgi:hypothetical protein